MKSDRLETRARTYFTDMYFVQKQARDSATISSNYNLYQFCNLHRAPVK